jgi:hypothetical protein
MRLILSTVAAIAATVAVQTSAHAHFIWATVESNQVRFALLENVAEAPNAKFEKYVTSLTPRSGGKTLTLGAPKDGARFAPLAAGQSVVVADSVIGAKDREGEAYLLVYHAKGAASLAAANTDTKTPAELRARRVGNELVVSVTQDGWAVPASEVYVEWPGSEAPTIIKTNFSGEARIAWPASAPSGFVGIRAKVTEPKVGEEGGKKYATVHHWSTLTFPLAGTQNAKVSAAAAAPAGATSWVGTQIASLLSRWATNFAATV